MKISQTELPNKNLLPPRKRWVKPKNTDVSSLNELHSQLQIPKPLCAVLIERGIPSFELARKFFRPMLEDLHDPFEMKDMEKAIARIRDAMDAGEKILVYGDYDVDGTTAVALVYTFLKKFYNAIDYYLPDRANEGYGISFQGIDWAKKNNFSLVIALDCGIKAVEKIHYANEKKIDFIICDHHLPGEMLPDAVAILNPKQSGCNYPYKELSGCGIGFKLVQALAKKLHLPFSEIHPYLDLAALSVASDIVPITGENRILAKHGLELINKKPRPGLRALKEFSAKKKNINVRDLVFIMGPRINAAGRMGDARDAVRLLISEEESHSSDHAELLNDVNTDRRAMDNKITQEALKMIEADKNFSQKKTVVLFDEQWHKGIIGIVASRITERFYRPTILLAQSNGKIVGSARSIDGVDIYSSLEQCADLLEQFGGHTHAAGLTLIRENVEPLIEKFERVVSTDYPSDLWVPEICLDAELELSDITTKFVRILKQFAPFGPENMQPVFVSENVFCPYKPKVVGNNHIKMKVTQDGKKFYDTIGFDLGNFAEEISPEILFKMAYTVEENEWNGNISVQLNVRDIQF